MKKIVTFLAFSFISLVFFSINASAAENFDEVQEDAGFETAFKANAFETEFVGDSFENLIPTVSDNTVSPATIARTMKWVVVSKTKLPNSYGPTWKTCVEDISRTGSVSCSLTSSVSNTYSGAVKVPIKTIEATLGYNMTKSHAVTLMKSYTADKGKRVKIIYRPVYTTYKVKQNRVLGSRVLETAYVTSKKYSHIQYDVIEY